MSRIKGLDELKQIKADALQRMKARDDADSPVIVVGMGTCGIAAGARDIMAAILDELGRRKLAHVKVSQTGCIGLCAREPIMEVSLPGQDGVLYGDLDSSKVRQIIAQHVVNGQPVYQWAINVGPTGQADSSQG